MTKAKVVFNFLNPGGVWAKVALRTSVIVEDYHFVLDVENSVLFIRIILWSRVLIPWSDSGKLILNFF